MTGKHSRRPSQAKEPVDVELTVKVRFGDEPEDEVAMIDQRHIPMVNSVFESRDAITRGFTTLLIRAALSQPKVVRELIPGLRFLSRVIKR
ncbi:MAG: hypothetical protein ACPGZP_11375 [Panacagrimonas sp.]